MIGSGRVSGHYAREDIRELEHSPVWVVWTSAEAHARDDRGLNVSGRDRNHSAS
jgi:hypothetical protein